MWVFGCVEASFLSILPNPARDTCAASGRLSNKLSQLERRKAALSERWWRKGRAGGEGREAGQRAREDAYHQDWHPRRQRVEEHGGHRAALLRARVRLSVGALVAEEALQVDREGVGVLEVISQHHGPCHDHHLEVKHSGRKRRRGHWHVLRRPRQPPSPAARSARFPAASTGEGGGG